MSGGGFQSVPAIVVPSPGPGITGGNAMTLSGTDLDWGGILNADVFVAQNVPTPGGPGLYGIQFGDNNLDFGLSYFQVDVGNAPGTDVAGGLIFDTTQLYIGTGGTSPAVAEIILRGAGPSDFTNQNFDINIDSGDVLNLDAVNGISANSTGISLNASVQIDFVSQDFLYIEGTGLLGISSIGIGDDSYALYLKSDDGIDSNLLYISPLGSAFVDSTLTSFWSYTSNTLSYSLLSGNYSTISGNDNYFGNANFDEFGFNSSSEFYVLSNGITQRVGAGNDFDVSDGVNSLQYNTLSGFQFNFPNFYHTFDSSGCYFGNNVSGEEFGVTWGNQFYVLNLPAIFDEMSVNGDWGFNAVVRSATQSGWTAFSNVTQSNAGLDGATATTQQICDWLAAFRDEMVNKGILAD